MEQNKNLILFVLTAICIFATWIWLQHQFWPPKPKPPQEVAQKDKDKARPKDKDQDKDKGKEPEARKVGPPANAHDVAVAAGVVGAVVPSGLEPLPLFRMALALKPSAGLAPDVAVAGVAGALALAPSGTEPLPLLGLALALELPRDALVKKILPKEPLREARPPEFPDVVRLGGPRHHIEALLTTRGAGVQKLILRRFHAANYLGQPARDKAGNFEDLELIPEDPFVPSYLLYHYLEFGDNARPVDTLGKQRWKLETPVELVEGETALAVADDPDRKGHKVISRPVSRPKSNDEEQQVRFTIDVPDLPVRITKTYTLRPGAYHIEMSLEIEHNGFLPQLQEVAELLRQAQAGTKEFDDLTEKQRNLQSKAREPVKQFRYQLSGAHGIPVEGEWFVTTPRTAVVGRVDSGDRLTRDSEDSANISFMGGGKKIPEALGPDSFIQYAGVLNQFFCSLIVADDIKEARAQATDDPRRKRFAWARPTLESHEVAGYLGGVSNDTLLIWVPQKDGGKKSLRPFHLLPHVREHMSVRDANLKENEEVMVSFYTLPRWVGDKLDDQEKVATWVRRGHTPRGSLDDITVRVVSQDFELKPGDRKIVHRCLLYNGPSKVKQLYQFSGVDAVPAEFVNKYVDTLHLGTVTDYGRFWLWSDLIIACSNVMHFLLYHLRFLGDGISIVLLTALVRGLMFPISRKQAIYSVKMQELAPEMKKIQEKYKDDPKARTEAIFEMYRKYNVHPLGGCLPILLQMPIFIGLYFSLQESVHFRLARFLWIPNLAAPDMLFWWGESIPIISDPNYQGGVVMDRGFFMWLSTFMRFFYLGPYFNLLPVIAVTFMIVQQKIMTPPPQDEQQAAQFKMMRYMMVFIGIMFYKVAAGLCMYIIISTVWGLAERRFLPKKQTALTPAAPTPPPAPAGGQRGPSGKKQPPSKTPPKKEGNMQKVRNWWQEVLNQAKKK